jgi:beta-phosphoglucomutase-like phosphatase (HAD superfamily)
VDPKRCAVVEDTVTGVAAGAAAGAMVFGYSPAEAGHDGVATLIVSVATTVFVAREQLAAVLI